MEDPADTELLDRVGIASVYDVTRIDSTVSAR